MIESHRKLALYMPQCVGQPEGKMGYGILRYSPHAIVCVIDPAKAGSDMTTEVGIPGQVPVVAGIHQAQKLGADVLVLGSAHSGGKLAESWYADLDAAVASGMCVVNGLHDPLAPRYPDLAKGQWVWDVRVEPSDLGVARARARALGAKRVLFVGSDMAVGKMTAALELWKAARERELKVEFVATGQTGIVIAGSGVALDAVRVDYAAGAVERELLGYPEADVIFVEGQGALGHPGSTATLPLMRGSCPTHLIFCHRAGQASLRSVPEIPIPPLREYIALCEALVGACGVFPPAKVVGVSLNTAHLGGEDAKAAVESLSAELTLPVSDPVRFGSAALLDALLGSPASGLSSGQR